ncbi:MAG TPA: MOSC domain-containing protein [Xanthobacteraceae bacterium]|jgi:hypothetical protein
MPAIIRSIYRYPVKGLSAEPLTRAVLAAGETVPGDRLYAIENGPSGFDPQHPAYLSKQHFLMLMKNERLASLRAAFDHESHVLTVTPRNFYKGEDGARGAPGADPSLTIAGNLHTAEGRAAIECFFAKFCADELRGPPKLLHADGHSFSDVARKVVSFINLASVSAIVAMLDAPVDPLRFRGNVYVEGWPAWGELDLLGKELIVTPSPPAGARSARLKVVKRIVRCAATNVEPSTGIRDLAIPHSLMRANGHADCGIYAEVIEGGEIAVGDEIGIG